ncbi:MAG: tRNA(fMet)-specific endonuclease VapC [Candidatus Heimdallarchaeota archaeon LC_3]|nr:MAG: tRNA(fMet)-specific endonuclease VapC [Candidatus Heimdallarchaeota archaeon LC_3]
MKFLDANIFIYAYYKPKRKLNEKEKSMKKNSQDIIRKINNGEEVLTSIVHLSEVSNILKKVMKLEDLQILLISLYSKPNITIIDVTKDDYLLAIDLIQDTQLDPNDCLALILMEREKIKEIYSYDSGFEKIKDIRRLP